MAGIKLMNVKKSYSLQTHRIEVLRGVNLEIPERCITVVLGKSGCGKTTLLRLVGGLEKADEGVIEFDKNHKSTFVFQEPRLMPWLSVWDNVIFGVKRGENERIQKIIDTVGLKGFEQAYPSQLSGGMQQRTAIARALAYQPSFIMLDEPFAALDYFTRDQMQKELIRLQRDCGVSMLFVTHSIDEALLLGHKIIVLENGCMKAEFMVDTVNGERELLEPNFIKLKKEILSQLGG